MLHVSTEGIHMAPSNEESDTLTISGGGTLNISAGSRETCWKVNGAYYIGKASSGKVAYAGPMKKV